jgi:hypothetical protein
MEYLTDAIYRASKPDAFQELYALSQSARVSKAAELNAAGYVIDWPIDVWGWDAGKVMAYRLQLGDLFVPRGFSNIPPGTDFSQPFQGAIKASVDAADYPAAHPAAPPPAPPVSPIGDKSTTPGVWGVSTAAFHNGMAIFSEGDAKTAPDGEMVYFHQFFAAPFGMPAWEWETAAAKTKRQAEEGTAIDNTGQQTGGAVQVNI